ncbi:unnamed protein product [Allacma fusca]|uniref:Transcription initiation factor TFIID subunit 8 n=1 Tax=Allacma fusca TaxID=39272 RepID=A0A8J2PM22_9HEXA|nr:unnamed protein product [Allacma fusca]
MDSQASSNPRRKILTNCVALLAQEAGYNQVEKAAVETLVESLQSLLMELGRTTRVYTELACRVEPTVGDVTLAMTELGLRIDPVGLRSFYKRHNRPIIPNIQMLPPPKTPTILSAGKRASLPPYVPDYFPPMPDPHCYIRTPTHKQPLTDYAACREKTSQTKRDLERSLTKFYARISPCFHLFPENPQLFPLIMPKPVTYLDPLIPRDQIFEEDESVPRINYVKKERPVDKAPKLMDDDDEDSSNENSQDGSPNVSWELIDNPFLRPPKVSKKSKA